MPTKPLPDLHPLQHALPCSTCGGTGRLYACRIRGLLTDRHDAAAIFAFKFLEEPQERFFGATNSDDTVLSTNIGYGTSPGGLDTSAVAMHLDMYVQEFEVAVSEQLTFLAFGVNGTGGASWSCFLRLEKLS